MWFNLSETFARAIVEGLTEFVPACGGGWA